MIYIVVDNVDDIVVVNVVGIVVDIVIIVVVIIVVIVVIVVDIVDKFIWLIQLVDKFGTHLSFFHPKMCIFNIQTIEILIFHWFCMYFVDSDRPSGVYFVDSDSPSGPAAVGS